MSDPGSIDERIGRRAARHHGIITRTAARALGMSDRQISGRVARGLWQRIAPGVFRIAGAPVTAPQRAYSAVLSAGADALVGGRSALSLFGLAPAPLLPCITVPPSASARTRDALVRRSAVAAPDRTFVGPIPSVTVARALVEVARREPATALPPLVDSAIHRGLAQPSSIVGALRRAGGTHGRPGARGLMEVLEPWMRGVTPGSPAEVRLLRRVEDWGLPAPVLQHEVRLSSGVVRIDVAWPADLVGLEYDGAEFHGPRQLAHDVDREEQLRRRGWWLGRVDRFDLAPSSTRLRDALLGRLRPAA